jgi:Ca2+/Na+ antiporter
MSLCDVGKACLAGESVYYPGSTFFIDPDAMSPLQLFWAFASYGYVLFLSANMIGDGAELLLLIPEYKDLVASVVLPILGAVPDGMMVLFSGIGPLAAAQENVAVGVGALAGSTIMLLTLPWVLSFYGGRVDFDAAGSPDAAYDLKKKDRDKAPGFFNKGVEFEDGARANAKIMMGTCLAYLVIQIPALMVDDQKAGSAQYDTAGDFIDEVKKEGSGVHSAALVGAIVTALLLALYLWLQVKAASAAQAEAADETPEENRPRAATFGLTVAPVCSMPDNWLETKGVRMHIEYLRNQAKKEASEKHGGDVENAYAASLQPLIATKGAGMPKDMKQELCAIYRRYAAKSVKIGITSKDMLAALQNMGLNYEAEEFDAMFKDADSNKSETLEQDEFIEFFSKYIIFSTKSLPWEGKDDDDEDEDEMPDEFKSLAPDAQRKAILKDSFQQMIVGTILVLLFSDPMVDVLQAMANMTGVPAFYVAFVLSPLASNASELVASFKLASKKTKESITQSLQTLEGAAIMNNTFCLGIFYALVYLQGLAWKFTAETISIVLVQVLVGGMVLVKNKQKMIYGIIVFLFYPLSLVVVAVLEANGID